MTTAQARRAEHLAATRSTRPTSRTSSPAPACCRPPPTPCSTPGSRRSASWSRSVPVAYALSRLRWRLRGRHLHRRARHDDAAAQVTAVPLYVLFAKLHLVGTLWPADPAELLRRRVLDLPAAPVLPDHPAGVRRRRPRRRRPANGGSCRQIVVPLARPAIAAVGALQLPLRLERLLRPAALHRREPDGVDGVRGAGEHPQPAPRAVEPDDGRDRAVHAAGGRCCSSCAQKAFVQGVTLTGVKG